MGPPSLPRERIRQLLEAMESHVVPLNDLREHESSRDCWCRPREDEKCVLVLIHNSMDRRELYERGKLLPA